MEKNVKTKDIKIGVIKRFTDKGVELSSDYEYVLLVKNDDKYVDIFDKSDEEKYAVFKRVPYTNATARGEEYGTKLLQINDFYCADSNDCLVLLNVDFRDVLGRDIISKEDLRDFALKSNFFIKQRKEYAIEKLKQLKEPLLMMKIILGDSLEEKRISKQKQKSR